MVDAGRRIKDAQVGEQIRIWGYSVLRSLAGLVRRRDVSLTSWVVRE
tara:strand:- start:233 stop:373 length:141 start_codon:yes stop_codon:yes gene_type:complete